MNGLKRFCKVVWALAGIFSLAALSLTWAGPWRDVASALMAVDVYWYALEACVAITGLGLLAVFFRAIFARKVKTVEIARVDGGSITVTRDAIASQASGIVEADGTCVASRVHVDAKPRGHVRVHVRVLPREPLDVVLKGAQLHEELVNGLAAVCGNTVENVSLEFVKPQAGPAPERAVDAEAVEEIPTSAASAAEAPSEGTSEASAPASPDSTSEITVSMGNARDAAKEA